jgi:hypothetical protein
MQTFSSLLSWRLFTAQHVSGVFPFIIRSSMTAVAASGFTFLSWWQSCCVRGRTGRWNPSIRRSTVRVTDRDTKWNIKDLQLSWKYGDAPTQGTQFWGTEVSFVKISENLQNIFVVHVTVHRDKFLIIKTTRCTNFSNLYLEGNSTYNHPKNKFEKLVHLVGFLIRKLQNITFLLLPTWYTNF